MPTIVEYNQIFSLSNSFFNYVFKVNSAGLLEHLYYGIPIENGHEASTHYRSIQRALTSDFEGVEHLSLNDLPQEFPCHGRSDYRSPAFHGRNKDGNSIFTFSYQSFEIKSGKPNLESMPCARGGDAQTLIIYLEDKLMQIELRLYYTIYEDHAVLIRSCSLHNLSENEIAISAIASTTLNFAPGNFELMHLHGTWAREFNEERFPIPTGKFTIESTRGASSANHYPFMAIMEEGTNEDYGQVYSTSLIYSGNFAMHVQKNEFDSTRLIAGINSFNFNWILKPNQSFEAPEAVHVFSDRGLNKMSQHWHRFIREKISPPNFYNIPRPSYLNTWEACYFNVSSSKVLGLAQTAASLGLEMIVLDDGWFNGRNDDASSLGDWVADAQKFPEGIAWLAAKVKQLGLKFGIWFEPEMISPESDLYKAHPEWAIQVPGRKASLGRNQLTLDLSQEVVVNYIFESLDRILSCGDIDYVKWDMNRAMTEIGSTALPKDQQGEVAHRYILGLYKLLDRITQKYPNILFENCASGGNRCDLGMLSYMPQSWTSDMCDPIGRLDIIHGASYILPNEVLTAYVGPSPNHQNGRVSSLKTRFLAGMLCAGRGFSLNEEDLLKYKDEIHTYSQLIKETEKDLLGGKFYRLIKSRNEVCFQYISSNASKIFVVYFQILSAPNLPFKKVRLKGLNPDHSYELKDNKQTYRGDVLMGSGIALPYATNYGEGKELVMEIADFVSHLFVFHRSD
ncbi:MAG: alpha-galactosidase [Bacteroidota bacterium]